MRVRISDLLIKSSANSAYQVRIYVIINQLFDHIEFRRYEMNKQKLIEEIKKEKYDFSKPETSLNSSDYKEGYNDASDDILDIIKKLDEPQKVKVPAFVAEYFNYCIANERTLAEALSGLDRDFKIPDYLYPAIKWLEDSINQNIFAQAWLYGYEVEQEQKWKIINDQKYCLTSIEAGYGNSLHWAFDSTKKKPILFDNEETALYTAYITGGTVEKV